VSWDERFQHCVKIQHIKARAIRLGCKFRAPTIDSFDDFNRDAHVPSMSSDVPPQSSGQSTFIPNLNILWNKVSSGLHFLQHGEEIIFEVLQQGLLQSMTEQSARVADFAMDDSH
jgi:hypothetical protein